MIITTNADFSKEIINLCKKYNVTHKELAIGVGVSQDSMTRYIGKTTKGQYRIPSDVLIKVLQFFIRHHIKKSITLSVELGE